MKLKLTDLNSGQESLLLVTKINLKGLLVQTANTLPLGTPVRLVLTIEEGTSPIESEGEIHKIAERPSGQKGMVIRFTKPSPELLRSIGQHIDKQAAAPQATEVGESQEYDVAPSVNKTMMVSEDTLSLLTFAPPQTKPSKKQREVNPTVDEEVHRQRSPDFAEETRIVQQAEFESFVKKTGHRPWNNWLWPVVFVVIVVPILTLLLNWLLFKKSPPTPHIEETHVIAIVPTVVTKPTSVPATPTVVPATSLQVQQTTIEKPTAAPKPISSELKKITVEETPAFLKISLEGPGVQKAEATRMMNPRRLVVDLKRVKTFSIKSSTAVGKNPLLRVRALNHSNGYVQIVLDLYPVDFPRYDVKEKSDSVFIYLYR